MIVSKSGFRVSVPHQFCSCLLGDTSEYAIGGKTMSFHMRFQIPIYFSFFNKFF